LRRMRARTPAVPVSAFELHPIINWNDNVL
jgi:hypothetical protein